MEWKKIDERLIKDGYRKILSKCFILPDGERQEFEINKGAEVVCILPITKENKVVLAEQFRPGPEKILLELPGGGILSDESPTDAVTRELLEETGYTGNIKFVQTIYDCAYSTLIRHVFVATDCEKKQKQNLDKTEFIKIKEMSLKDFRKHLQSGQLTDIEVGYLGLDFLGLL